MSDHPDLPTRLNVPSGERCFICDAITYVQPANLIIRPDGTRFFAACYVTDHAPDCYYDETITSHETKATDLIAVAVDRIAALDALPRDNVFPFVLGCDCNVGEICARCDIDLDAAKRRHPSSGH